MSLRYSRSEKEKWVTGTNKPGRRSPVRIPKCDNSSLIEANRFTLIGRVTNPLIQKPKAVVNYFPQFWNLDSVVTGRDLGRDRFLFKFETEEALQSVLRKGPFHYKRWMLILQRWEPIASDLFPALLSFWVKIHGLPVHLWTSQTIRTIGCELGQISVGESGVDPENSRIRVQINGLEPLEMVMPVRMPTGEVISVELEYEKLEKHCFTCFSLLHEESDCPKLRGKEVNPHRILGINQQKTLLKLEADKQKAGARKEASKLSHPQLPRGDSSKVPSRSYHRDPTSNYHRPRLSPPLRQTRDLGRRRDSPQGNSSRSYSRHHSDISRSNRSPSSRNRAPHSRISQSRGSHSFGNGFHYQHLQLPYNRDTTPARGEVSDIRVDINKKLSSPSLRLTDNPARTSGQKAKGKVDESPKGRRPALERITQSVDLSPQPPLPTTSSNSNRLQDVNIQYLDDESHFGVRSANQLENGVILRSSPRIPMDKRLSLPSSSTAPQEREPRVPVSQRLGPQIDSVTVTLPTKKPEPKVTRKRKTAAEKAQAAAIPRGARSPLKGASSKKQSITRPKAKQSPKKKLKTNTLPENQVGPSSVANSGPPPPVMIPAISKNGVDFQNPPPRLP